MQADLVYHLEWHINLNIPQISILYIYISTIVYKNKKLLSCAHAEANAFIYQVQECSICADLP